MPKVSWPVVALSSNDRFLHVSRDAADLRAHVATDLAEGFTVPPLDFYDVDGRRLQPLIGPQWTVAGFAATGDQADEDELLRRMERALRFAERIDRQRTVKALVAEGMSVGDARKAATRRATRISGGLPEQAEHVLELLNPAPSDQAEAFNRGGWLHSAWHAAFG